MDLKYARAAMLWSPGEDFEAQLSYMWQDDHTGGRRQVTSGVNQVTGRKYKDYEYGAVQKEPSDREVQLTALEMDVGLGFATLTSSTSYFGRTESATATIRAPTPVTAGSGSMAVRRGRSPRPTVSTTRARSPRNCASCRRAGSSWTGWRASTTPTRTACWPEQLPGRAISRTSTRSTGTGSRPTRRTRTSCSAATSPTMRPRSTAK